MSMKQLHPVVRNFNSFIFILLIVSLEALAVRMHDEFPNLVREYGVCHIPEVLPLALATFRIAVGEVWPQLLVLKQLRVHGFH